MAAQTLLKKRREAREITALGQKHLRPRLFRFGVVPFPCRCAFLHFISDMHPERQGCVMAFLRECFENFPRSPEKAGRYKRK
ncbi:MAG: hypothetical protein MR400_09400 [Clostridiales bacterium]|nr:hypothetical protein [Clostridiales bacterium]